MTDKQAERDELYWAWRRRIERGTRDNHRLIIGRLSGQVRSLMSRRATAYEFAAKMVDKVEAARHDLILKNKAIGSTSICDWLNGREIWTRKGGEWSERQLIDQLYSPADKYVEALVTKCRIEMAKRALRANFRVDQPHELEEECLTGIIAAQRIQRRYEDDYRRLEKLTTEAQRANAILAAKSIAADQRKSTFYSDLARRCEMDVAEFAALVPDVFEYQ